METSAYLLRLGLPIIFHLPGAPLLSHLLSHCHHDTLFVYIALHWPGTNGTLNAQRTGTVGLIMTSKHPRPRYHHLHFQFFSIVFTKKKSYLSRETRFHSYSFCKDREVCLTLPVLFHSRYPWPASNPVSTAKKMQRRTNPPRPSRSIRLFGVGSTTAFQCTNWNIHPMNAIIVTHIILVKI